MKNAKRNVIVSAFMAIALCMSVVAGATLRIYLNFTKALPKIAC